ncbi:cupin domain-containing protein [Microbacterium sp. AR7-10]|uniref:cupin domain-containing protein n=1 Tax=Microbacterium sp. AR7-10 TaxID=1891970 RepID=UPI0008FC3643|nr:cupin domain-containing protein [Microbacterium sp. AR7-10]OIU88697.1 cupin [Microbacterium sp. AR7-10]
MTDATTTAVHNRAGERIVISPADFGSGAPMEVGRTGVRDKKLIYPEMGFDAATLCLGIVEIDPGHHSPLHRHNCEEVYYVIEGTGYVEQEGDTFPLNTGDAVLNRVNVDHRVFNTGETTMRLAVVGGIMLVPLLPTWPTESPYEILEPAGEN